MTAPIADKKRIETILPHRGPMLMLDEITEVVQNESAVAVKYVTDKEFWHEGHFPGRPVMPGVLIIEAMAQAGAALFILSGNDEHAGKIVYFMAIDEAKFRKPVVPGDKLYIHVKKEQGRRTVWKLRCEARVNGELCAEGLVTAMVAENK
jgi:3-hydroxyacyl-[acyl-carrier-protein] dehydratase